MSFTTNAKGTSIGRSTKKNKLKTVKKMSIGKYISIIILNVNGLNSPTKNWLAEWIQKHNICRSCCLQDIYSIYYIYYILYILSTRDSKHYSQWWKTESIPSKIWNKTRVPTLTAITQHSFGSPSYGNQRSKRNKSNPDWKRSKPVTVCRWHDSLHRKP